MDNPKVKTILDELKRSRSFDEAQLALDKVQSLSKVARAQFKQELKEVFKDASEEVSERFRVLYVEPLNDIETSAKPEFRVLAYNP